MMGFVAAFVVLPFGSHLIIADMNVGVLYVTSVTSLVVVGILMAGYPTRRSFVAAAGRASIGLALNSVISGIRNSSAHSLPVLA